MGRFVNSQEFREYELRYCRTCMHGTGCPVLAGHREYSAIQCEDVLNAFIPFRHGRNELCTMFAVSRFDGEVIRSGGLTLETGRKQLFAEDRQAQLTPVEYQLVHYLIVNAGRTCATRELLDELWGFRDMNKSLGTMNIVRVHIRNIRNKIEMDASNPQYIRTISHHGYMIEKDE